MTMTMKLLVLLLALCVASSLSIHDAQTLHPNSHNQLDPRVIYKKTVEFEKYPITFWENSQPNPDIEVTMIQQDVSGRPVVGFLAVLANPSKHVSVKLSLASSKTVNKGISFLQCVAEKTSEIAKSHKCLFAMSAGFSGSNGHCEGHIFSDLQLSQLENTLHSSFGLTKDGHFVTGYLQTGDMKNMELEALVTGRGWLIRHNATFTNESLVLEKLDAAWAEDWIPRAAIGHDSAGRLMLFQVDGQKDFSGVSLWEFAELFRKLGAYSAINLAGGPSCTSFYRGQVINKPTCADYAGGCEEKVPSIICIS